MTVEINGEQTRLDDGASLTDAIATTGADPDQRGLAVAVDGEVVPKAKWALTTLSEGQQIEVVRAIQGG